MISDERKVMEEFCKDNAIELDEFFLWRIGYFTVDDPITKKIEAALKKGISRMRYEQDIQ